MESYEELSRYSDADIIKIFDTDRQNVVVGKQWYLDELVRRRQDRATEALVDLTKRLRWLTIVLVVFTIIGSAAAVYAAVKAG